MLSYQDFLLKQAQYEMMAAAAQQRSWLQSLRPQRTSLLRRALAIIGTCMVAAGRHLQARFDTPVPAGLQPAGTQAKLAGR